MASPSIIQKAANNFRNHFNMAFKNTTLEFLRKYRELLCRSVKPLILPPQTISLLLIRFKRLAASQF